MSYQALYRAWRPDTFSQMCGQEAVVRTLRRQVETGRIAHAYLFCGTRGTGKTTAAKVLSRAVNCLSPHNGDPCGECEACLALKAENCMDVLEIDAASNNGVDEIRDLREKIKYPPTLTRYKVYIIDEVHMLSTGAFNALLKTLEEPPKHAVFILATTEPHKLPATILSRCQRFDFQRISAADIIARLHVVLEGIGRSASEEALKEIARAAEGAMRDALSLLDVCLSFTEGEVSAQLARDVLGTTGREFMFEFADAILAFDAAAALEKIDEAVRRGSDPRVFALDAAAHLRAILLASISGERIESLLEITKEDAQRFCDQAKQANREQLMRTMELFMRAPCWNWPPCAPAIRNRRPTPPFPNALRAWKNSSKAVLPPPRRSLPHAQPNRKRRPKTSLSRPRPSPPPPSRRRNTSMRWRSWAKWNLPSSACSR